MGVLFSTPREERNGAHGNEPKFRSYGLTEAVTANGNAWDSKVNWLGMCRLCGVIRC